MLNFIKPHKNKFLFAIAALLFLGFSLILFYHLGNHPYIDFNESIYAQVAKESFVNHHFFDLSYFGHPWFIKPPLAFWLMSISYAIGGINEWTGRLPSVLAALGMVIISLRWIYEIKKSYTAVILGLAGYFIMFPFITTSYFINLDTIVGFFVMLSLYAWWKAIASADKKLTWFVVWGVAIGLGVMTESILGFFPIVPIVLFMFFGSDFKFLKNREFWYGVMAMAVVILPWHIYQSIKGGFPFWDNYLFIHVLNRYTGSLENEGSQFSYYFELVFYRYFLALAVFGGTTLISVWLVWKNRGVRYVLFCTVTLFLMFSLSFNKLPSEITMVLPLIVILFSIVFARLISFAPRKWMQGLVVIILTAVFIYTGYAFNTYKLVVGEGTEEFLSNKGLGEFLKDYRTELPVYVDAPYSTLGIGYYANRPLISTQDKALIDAANLRVKHQPLEEVFLGKNADGKEYLMIKR